MGPAVLAVGASVVAKGPFARFGPRWAADVPGFSKYSPKPGAGLGEVDLLVYLTNGLVYSMGHRPARAHIGLRLLALGQSAEEYGQKVEQALVL